MQCILVTVSPLPQLSQLYPHLTSTYELCILSLYILIIY